MEKLIIFLECVGLVVVIFTIVYWASFIHPIFNQTMISLIPPKVSGGITVIGFLLVFIGERIQKKEASRNKFVSHS
jgi:hypothetical protein